MEHHGEPKPPRGDAVSGHDGGAVVALTGGGAVVAVTGGVRTADVRTGSGGVGTGRAGLLDEAFQRGGFS